jgi:hypothetical protein
MAQGVTVDDVAAQVAALSGRMTAVEQGLTKAVSDFTPIGKRVTELSAAFQEANVRLAAMEAALVEIRETQALPADERLDAIDQALAALSARLSAVETQRQRGGRLSKRLADIEARLPNAGGME